MSVSYSCIFWRLVQILLKLAELANYGWSVILAFALKLEFAHQSKVVQGSHSSDTMGINTVTENSK